MSITKASLGYKPFHFPWAYEYWKIQQQVHWMPEEVPLGDDITDWHKKLTPEEKNLLTQIFRFFTQSDVEVNNCYMKHYAQVFKPTEVQMMLSAFSNMETIHIAAYALLLDTIGMPESEYQAFLEYGAMKAKHDYMQGCNMDSKEDIAKTLAIFSAFTEGLQLFASFAMLLNFPRHNKMKGMGQIISWSVRDESLHCEGMTRVFRTFIEENREIWNDDLKSQLYQACRDVVEMEDKFIDLAFELGPVEGLTADEVKQYIRYIADRRLIQLGLKPNFGVDRNPLPWMAEMLNGVEFGNFFESRVTEYSKGTLQGDWGYDDEWLIYTIPECPYCAKAKELLDLYGIEYRVVMVEAQNKASTKQELGHNSFPIILRNRELVGGYDDLAATWNGNPANQHSD